jgi:hypothetical protein
MGKEWHYEEGEFGPEPVLDDPESVDEEGQGADEPLPDLPSDSE